MAMDFGYSIHSMKSRKLCERVARALPKKRALPSRTEIRLGGLVGRSMVG